MKGEQVPLYETDISANGVALLTNLTMFRRVDVYDIGGLPLRHGLPADLGVLSKRTE